jgi:SAM-dependent methyltransferase
MRAPGPPKAVRDVVERLRPGATSLLDVACGTGRHLGHFRRHLRCEGVDFSPDMIEIARARLSDVRITRGDMVDLDLGRRFDVVTCLFSSIGYVATIERLRRAIAAMGRHLTPGGVLIIEPWVLPEDWIDSGTNIVDRHYDAGWTYVRVISSRRDATLSHLQIHYAVAHGGEIQIGDEHHVLGLFTKADYLDAADSAGLSPEWIDGGLIGRGLVAAVVPM